LGPKQAKAARVSELIGAFDRQRHALAGFNMRSSFHASATMFVFLKGHDLLEYYFAVSDARRAANDCIGPHEPDG